MSHILQMEDEGSKTRREQAQRAVAEFRKLQPILSTYARVLSKNENATVELAARDNGSTDGNRIFYRPPIALGDDTPHSQKLCYKRGEDGLMLCRACATREEVLVTIYHEIFHIAFDSFARISDSDKRTSIEFATREIGGPYGEKLAKRIAEAKNLYSYMALARYLNEYLPTIVNALEDARVNEEGFKARAGVRKMFAADETRIFIKGVEVKGADGNVTIKKWNEQPLNNQILVGLYSAALGYDYSGWFHPKVIDALREPELASLLAGMRTVRSASAVYNLSLKVLARLRELGFLATENDPDEKGDPGDPSDSSDSKEGESDSDAVPPDSGQPSDAADDEPSAGGESSPMEPDPSDASPSDDAEGDSDGSADGEAGEVDDSVRERSGDESGDVPEDGEESDDAGSGDSGEGEASDHDSKDDSTSKGSDSSPADSTHVPEGSDFSDGDESEEGSDSSQPGDPGSANDSSGQADGDSDPESDSHADGGLPASDSDVPGEQSGGDPSSGDEPEPVRDGADGSSGVPEPDQPDGDSDSEGGGIAGSGDIDSTGDPSASGGDTPEGDDGVAPGEEATAGEEPSDSDMEAIDTGADDGYGGTRLNEPEGEAEPQPDYGTPDDIGDTVKEWMGHAEKPKTAEVEAAEAAVDTAIVQGIYFTTPSTTIRGVKEYRYEDEPPTGDEATYYAWAEVRRARARGKEGDFDVPEQILQPALLRTRRVFSDNQRGSNERNKRSGHIRAKSLGKRAPLGDDRLFSKRILPGRKDYFVVIGMDVSGSTVGVNLALEKRAVLAQAELLDRVGIEFAVYAHTGSPKGGRRGVNQDLDMYIIKERRERWTDECKERLRTIGSSAYNLDGHAMEYLRKRAEESDATDKVVLYYSDGKMPAENHDEELSILRREISTCRRKGITLLGVGIRTDSPARHGLETVQVDNDEDLVKVVQLLGKRLEKR